MRTRHRVTVEFKTSEEATWFYKQVRLQLKQPGERLTGAMLGILLDRLKNAVEVEPAQFDKCECGGELKFYDGALGYEANVCQKCGEHWADTSPEMFDKHLAEYLAGKRSA